MRAAVWLSLCLGLWSFGGAGCAPADLEPLPDTGANTAGQDANLSDAQGPEASDADTPGDGSSTRDDASGATSFPQVAQTLAANCGIPYCHGENHNGNYHIEGGTEASVEAVRLALEGVDSLEEIPLVDANNPSGSAIYQRITGEGNEMPPPPNPSLPQEQIDTIRDWIAQGARYE